MQKFYICQHCGNLIGMVKDVGVKVSCCGEPMQELIANTADAAQEKHLPVANVEGSLVHVKVGSTAHPMLKEHLIEWIYLETENGGQRKALKAGETPETVFALSEDKAVAVYAYCNLHGLWKTEL